MVLSLDEWLQTDIAASNLEAEYEQSRKRTRKLTTPRVYFVQAEKLGLIKIGLTRDVRERLRTLQICSPDRLALIGAIFDRDAGQIEASLHVRFKADHSHGEWFFPSPAILDYIADWPVARADQAERLEWNSQQTAPLPAPPSPLGGE